MVQFSVRLTPTKEEIMDGLKRARVRKAGPFRLIAQTVALALVAAWSLIAFFGDGMHDMMSLVIGVVAVLLIPVMWLVPRWQIHSLAQSAVDSGAAPKLWVFEDGIDFGEEQPEYAYYPYGSFFADIPKEQTCQTIVMKFPNDDVIVVPKGVLREEEWDYLCEKLRTTIRVTKKTDW